MCNCRDYSDWQDEYGPCENIITGFACPLCESENFKYHKPLYGDDYDKYYECFKCNNYIKANYEKHEGTKEIFYIDIYALVKVDGKIYIWKLSDYNEDDPAGLCSEVPEFSFTKDNLLNKIKTCILFQ